MYDTDFHADSRIEQNIPICFWKKSYYYVFGTIKTTLKPNYFTNTEDVAPNKHLEMANIRLS